jgi:hypothetical protein
MQETSLISSTENKKDLLLFTSLGLAVAIVSSVLFAILIHGGGSGAKSFIREPDTLPVVTISITNPGDSAVNGIVDVYCQLYYAVEGVNSEDTLINGIKLRTNTENGDLSLNPNLLGDGKFYLAIEVVEPHGYTIQDFKGSNVEIQQLANDNSILIADLQNIDPVLSSVTVQIELAPIE